MIYQFEKVKRDYSDLASGRVLYSKPGATAFPLRAASEIFQHCFAHLRKDRHTIYDPCCGSAYYLTALGFLHFDRFERIICSDIDEDALGHARKNLDLLTIEGINRRMLELETLQRRFGKESHREALESAQRLKMSLQQQLRHRNIRADVFNADILQSNAVLELRAKQIDIVFADVPYGMKSQWWEQPHSGEEIWTLLDNILSLKVPLGLVVIAASKHQRVEHDGYAKVERMKIGTRAITILQPKSCITLRGRKENESTLPGSRRPFPSCRTRTGICSAQTQRC